MALNFLQSVKGEKSFKGKIIAEIALSFWILDLFLSLKMENECCIKWMDECSNIGLSDYTCTLVIDRYGNFHLTDTDTDTDMLIITYTDTDTDTDMKKTNSPIQIPILIWKIIRYRYRYRYR